jgi:hypothetical protein
MQSRLKKRLRLSGDPQSSPGGSLVMSVDIHGLTSGSGSLTLGQKRAMLWHEVCLCANQQAKTPTNNLVGRDSDRRCLSRHAQHLVAQISISFMANPRFITTKWKREFGPEIAVLLAGVVSRTMHDYSCLWQSNYSVSWFTGVLYFDP